MAGCATLHPPYGFEQVQRSARRIQAPRPNATSAPSAISGMLPVPNSSSHSAKATIAVKMPPISDGRARLTLISLGTSAMPSRLGGRQPGIGGGGPRLLQILLAEPAVIAVED